MALSHKQRSFNQSIWEAFGEYLGACHDVIEEPNNFVFFNAKTNGYSEPIKRGQAWKFIVSICNLATIMIYAEISVHLLRQDYYQGMAAIDPGSENLTLSGPAPTRQHTLRQLVEEFKTAELDQSRQNEILDIILANIS